MPYLDNTIYDSGLTELTTNGNRLDICSQEPTSYVEATSTYTLGTSTITINSPTDRTAGGREVEVNAVINQPVTSTGTATHYAIIDDSSNTLLATNTLTESQAVTSGNNFSVSPFKIGIPSPV